MDPLTSLDASFVQGADWTKRTLTITRQPFSYPHYGDRVHVVLDSCRASPHPDYMYELDRESMLPLVRAGRSRSCLNGCFRIDVRKQRVCSFNDVDSTSVYIEVRYYFDNEDGRRVAAVNRPPYLLVGTREMSPSNWSRDPLSSGETRVFPATEGELRISARYVNRIDEFLWSIKIVPVGSEIDHKSEEKQEIGASSNEHTNDDFQTK